MTDIFNELEERYENCKKELEPADKAYWNQRLSVNFSGDKEADKKVWEKVYVLERDLNFKSNKVYRAEQELFKHLYDNKGERWWYHDIHKNQCPYCDRDFYCKNPAQKYCHRGCAKRIYFQRRKDKHYKKLEGRKCIKCDIVFRAKRMNMIYCSKSCKQKAYRGRNK